MKVSKKNSKKKNHIEKFLLISVIVTSLAGVLIARAIVRDISPFFITLGANTQIYTTESQSEPLPHTSSTATLALNAATNTIKKATTTTPTTSSASLATTSASSFSIIPAWLTQLFASPSTTPSKLTQGDPPQATINPQTIAGVLCYYNVYLISDGNGTLIPAGFQRETRGSGVIIDSKGDILTNRHVVSQPDEYVTASDNTNHTIPVVMRFQLDHCDVGQLPATTHLPTASEISTFNPYIQIPVLGYTAQPVFFPNTSGLSNNEIAFEDFAILKITGVSMSGPIYGVTSVPSSFPYAHFLAVKPYTQLNGGVVTYGFPGDVTSGQGNFFSTLTMTGSVGKITGVDYGDHFFADTPLTLHTDVEIAHGRSGSPLFWRGYVVGIIMFYQHDNRTDSGSVATDAIIQGLRGSGYSLSP
jgi:S1-C subfamily serine protease